MDLNKIGRRIAQARKRAGLTQEQLAEQLTISPQAVSKWENGWNLPDLENLLHMAELLNLPYTSLIDEEEDSEQFQYRDRLFQEENMFTRLKATAQAEGLTETYKALSYMRQKHLGQYRNRGQYSSVDVQYINHPLMMACHAHAMGIRDDALLAAILLHDVIEDTNTALEELPFSEEVRRIVELVTFKILPGMDKKQSKAAYYECIRQDKKASVVKVIDRCNNVSTLAGHMPKAKMTKCVQETETYIIPILDELKHNAPEYSDVAFLVKYQILSLLETVKNMMKY